MKRATSATLQQVMEAPVGGANCVRQRPSVPFYTLTAVNSAISTRRVMLADWCPPARPSPTANKVLSGNESGTRCHRVPCRWHRGPALAEPAQGTRFKSIYILTAIGDRARAGLAKSLAAPARGVSSQFADVGPRVNGRGRKAPQRPCPMAGLFRSRTADIAAALSAAPRETFGPRNRRDQQAAERRVAEAARERVRRRIASSTSLSNDPTAWNIMAAYVLERFATFLWLIYPPSSSARLTIVRVLPRALRPCFVFYCGSTKQGVKRGVAPLVVVVGLRGYAEGVCKGAVAAAERCEA